jgi:ornithine cyclodeaminase/alanine dehydrogenase-like protein (mu-crystallin family)
LVISLSVYRPDMREMDPVLEARARVIVDSDRQ